jgi:hypothetical protein
LAREVRWTCTGLLALLLLLPITVGCADSGDDDHVRNLRLSTNQIVVLSPEGGGYHAFSQLLAHDLTARLGGEYSVRLVTSTRDGDVISGSMDVLDAMARNTEGQVHYLGLSQSDVAYHFRYGGHPMYEVPHPHRERLSALAKLFPETLTLYSSAAPTDEGVEQWEFDDYQSLWQSLYLGELGSGTLITTYNVFPIISSRPLGTPPPGLRQHRKAPPPVDAREQPAGPPSHFGASFVSSQWNSPATALLGGRGGTLISLSSSQQRHLVSVYAAFYRASRFRDRQTLTKGTDAGGGLSIEIPALLVADRALPEVVARAVFALLGDLDRDPDTFVKRLSSSGEGQPTIEAAALRNLIAAINEYRGERYLDLILPAHRTLLALPPTNFLPPLVVAVICLLLLIVLLRSCVRRSLSGFAWLQMPRSLVVGVALTLTLLWFHACLAIVMILERRAYLTYEIDTASLFIQRSYVDLLPGLMHYTASGFSMQDLIPRAYVAQLVWLSIPFILALSVLGGTMHLAVPPVVRYLGRVLKGEVPLKTTGHILILHWHQYAIHVVRQLDEHTRLEGREAQSYVVFSPKRSAVEIPVTSERSDTALGHYTIHKTTSSGEESRVIEVAVLERDPRTEGSLQLSALARARFVIVFPVPDHPEPDSVTVILLLRMQQLLAGQEIATRPKILVWAQDPAKRAPLDGRTARSRRCVLDGMGLASALPVDLCR